MNPGGFPVAVPTTCGSRIAAACGGVLLAILAAVRPACARLPRDAPALPPPDASYTVVPVSTAQQLADACWNLASNQAIVIAPGTYDLASVNFPNGVDGRLTVGRYGASPIRHIQIRGATGNPADVVLVGAGMTDPLVPFGFQIFTASDVVIADLSVHDVYYHDVAVQGDQGAHQVHLYHLRLYDAGEQLVKGVPAADDVSVEYSELFFTAGAVDHPAVGNTCYTNAVDGVTVARWIVRDNLIHGIRCQDLTLAGPAILLWQGSSDSLVERNTIIDSSRGIALGLTGSTDHLRGIVRNNFVHWDANANYAVDVPIYTTSPNAELLNNTALTAGRYPNAIEVRYSGATGVQVINNLLDAAIQPRDGAAPTLSNNLTAAPPGWFVDPAAGDLHLTALAGAAIGHATALADASDDFDAQSRPPGTNRSDIGADQTLPDWIFADGFGG
jgi:hypothetical protein